LSPVALALILASAAIHALWNMIYKRSNRLYAFPLFKSMASLALLLPLGVWGFTRLQPEPQLLWRAPLSGLFYALYFVFMSAAFSRGDLSLVYPISRGVGPLLTAVGGVLLLGERLSAAGIVGIAVIVAAVAAISFVTGNGNGTPGHDRDGAVRGAGAVAYACLVGVCIAVYGVNDKVGVSIAHPFTFLLGGVAASLCVLGPFCALKCGRDELRACWRDEKALFLTCSVLDTLSYLLYLYAMAMGAQTGYATPMRSLCVVFGAFLGAKVLKESRGGFRIAAATAVALGVVLVGVWGRPG